MKYRTERDSMGEIKVPADRYWGAQTQRSLENFRIGAGHETMPDGVIFALAALKAACAKANRALLPDRMTEEKLAAVTAAAAEILGGKLDGNFPLVVFQTGSGTQTNMNVNEVIACRGNEIAGKNLLHPNDDVNMSQSSNDIFPSAMYVAAARAVKQDVIPALEKLCAIFRRLEKENDGVIKCGRTHLQDATPVSFPQEISGWRGSVEKGIKLLEGALEGLSELAVGGTAVGTGLNAPEGFDRLVCSILSGRGGSDPVCPGVEFRPAENKFTALTSRSAIVTAHGCLKAVACDLMKIANDIRWLASGPRLGLGEITIPANEPGSSIMPGKVNPTQCEAVTMVAVKVMGNDASIGIAASQGNFELNVFAPVMISDFLQSSRLIAECVLSFAEKCVAGIVANREKMRENLGRSLMLVTALSPVIGYAKAAETAKLALKENISLKEACLKLGYLTGEEFDAAFRPEDMV